MKSSPNTAPTHGPVSTHRVGLLLWCCLVGLQSAPARATLEYELRGVVRDEPRALDIHFEVCVRDCLWRIRCWHQDGRGLYFDTALLSADELIRVVNYSTQRWATAVIESNQIPTGCEESVTPLLWLFMASGCAWSPAGTGQITPVYDPLASTLMDRDRLQLARWELLGGPPFLPGQVVYLNEGHRRLWDSRTGRATLVPLPPPYDQGYTNAVATILEVATVDGLALPRRFRFEQFSTGGTNRGANLRLARRLEGRVEHARSGCSHADLVPRPPFRTAVQDRRFAAARESGLITYSVPDGGWPDIAQLRKIRKRQQRGGIPGAGQVALFCLVALAPLVAVFWRRRRMSGRGVVR